MSSDDARVCSLRASASRFFLSLARFASALICSKSDGGCLGALGLGKGRVAAVGRGRVGAALRSEECPAGLEVELRAAAPRSMRASCCARWVSSLRLAATIFALSAGALGKLACPDGLVLGGCAMTEARSIQASCSAR